LNFLFSVCLTRCDADPSALANYVVALVKKDKPEKELKAFCADQLDVFLQKGNYCGPSTKHLGKDFKFKTSREEWDMVVHTSNPSTWEIEAGGQRVTCQPGLQGNTLSQTKQNDRKLTESIHFIGKKVFRVLHILEYTHSYLITCHVFWQNRFFCFFSLLRHGSSSAF
jgi:hypothetical protein